MLNLIFHKQPERTFRTLVAAFAGWPDAAEAATRAVQYLVNKMPARRMAEIDPEEFYDFSTVRPLTRLTIGGDRIIKWPENVFYHSAPEAGGNGAVLLVGVEPSLKWRAYTDIVMGIIERFGIERVVSLGALLDAVPHTREVKITGVATTQAARDELAKLGMLDSGYQGPSAIHTALMDACTKKGIPHISLWGHCPHYVNTSPNPVVSHALLSRLAKVSEVSVDLGELKESAAEFETQVADAVGGTPEITSYVLQLEEQYDEATPKASDMPNPEKLVAELEEFLKMRREQNNGGDGAAG